jgi:autotransporter-associated beta strand protein
MQPTGDATPGTVTVGTLSGIGAITNASVVTNTTLLNPGTSSTAGTLSIASNFNFAAGAGLTFNVTNDVTVGAGVNDLINVAGNLTLNNNLLTAIPMATTLASGTYRIINYAGTRSGTLAFTNPTHYNVTIDYSTPNQVNAIVSGSPASVRWNSTNSSIWDTSTTNWFNTTSAVIDRFGQLDNVVINDSGGYTNFLSLSTILFPNTIQAVGTKDYNLGGAGKISGGASISKFGSGTLTISNANDFTGLVTINGGVLRVANATALGLTNGGTTINSGGALDLSGTSLYSPGEFFTIAGNGPTNGGAIINTGANQNNGVRYVSLTADASIGSWPGRFDIRGPAGSGSFSGGLYLNGFTLTKMGPAQQSIVDTIATNSGSFVIAGGTLSFTRSQIDGPGYVNVLTNVLLFENNSTGYLAKPISVGGGAIRVVGNSVGLGVNITNTAGATFDIASGQTLTCTNPISGAGYLTKITAGNLILNAVNTYSGPTTIIGGKVTLGLGASIANTPSIAVGAGTTFDISAVAGFSLTAGETLSGGGAITGDVTAPAANTIVPGDSDTGPGTLSFGNSLTLNSSTNIIELDRDPTQVGGGFNDLISVAGNLTLNGVTTLKISPIGPLSTATPYSVITYAGTLSGGLANLQVVSDNPRYSFAVVDPATTPGSIQVTVSGIAPILLWTGGQPSNPRAWDLVTSNWLNGATSDRFFAGDSVQFDDTATTNVVSLIASDAPGAMAVTNSTLPYTFGGPGALKGGSLTKDLAASLAFTNSGSVSFSSDVSLNNGAVSFANGSTNIFGGALVVNAGPVTFNNSGPDNFTGGLTVNANVNVQNSFANAFGPTITLNSGTLTLNQPLDVTVGSVLGNTTPSVAGNIVKQGANALILSGNSPAFDGPILVSGGTLRAGNNNALGNANGDTTIASGATFDIAGFSLYNPGDIINIAGVGLSSTGAVINTGGAQNNAVRALNLTADATIAAWGNRWDVRGNGGSGSHSGALNLNGFTLTKLGASTNSVVDCATVGDGSIEVLGGTLSLTRTEVDAPGHINVSSNLLVFENFSTGDPVTKGIVISGGTIRLTGNTFTLGSPITNNLPGMTFDVASGLTLTAQGTIVGGGSLSKITAGTLILTAPDSTWGVSTSIGAGTLQIGSGAADGSLRDLPTANNGTLIINSLNAFVITNQITGSGAITVTAGHLTLGGSNTYSGAVLVNSTTATDPNGAILTISNSFALGTNTGNTHIVGNTTGNGRLELLGNISVADPMLIDCRQSGTINLPAILNVSGSNTISGQITGSTGGSDMNFQSDSGKLTMSGGFNCTTTAGTRRLKLMGGAFGEWSGVISNSADGLVNTIVVKTNSGSWKLSAANIYSGSTIIGGGTLALGPAGSINNSTNIDVQSGAVFDVTAVSGGYILRASQSLKGNGSVVGNVTANGSVTPGESIGTLTFSNNVVLAGTTTMEIDRDATPNADLIVANSLTYGGALTVVNNGAALQAGDTFNLFDWTTRSGSFSSTNLPALDPGLSWDTSNLSVDGTIRVSTGSSVNIGRTNLTFFVSGNSLDISWPADHTGWRLQSQTNPISVGLRSNWFDVPGSTTTNHFVMPINPANGSVFYRMVYP